MKPRMSWRSILIALVPALLFWAMVIICAVVIICLTGR